jgi:hypothetical protein
LTLHIVSLTSLPLKLLGLFSRDGTLLLYLPLAALIGVHHISTHDYPAGLFINRWS